MAGIAVAGHLIVGPLEWELARQLAKPGDPLVLNLYRCYPFSCELLTAFPKDGSLSNQMPAGTYEYPEGGLI